LTVPAKPHLGQLQPAVHGGPDYAELAKLGIGLDELLDFSVSINPAPAPPELSELLAGIDLSTYPDGESRQLREAAAECYGVTPEHVLAGNGSSELIWLIAFAYLEPGDSVLVLDPSFGEYERAARLCQADVTRVMVWQTSFPPNIAELLDQALEARQPKIAFVCNPNNPTGQHVSTADLLTLARHHPETLLVLDEAYADFVAGRPTAIRGDMPDNLTVLRSLTKFSGLAGLRLGLVFAQPAVIATLRTVKPPWNVNALAQAAGTYALRHPTMLPDLETLAAATDELMDGLRRLSFEPQATACNFFLVPVGDGRAFRRRLLEKRCLVRDCASFGLPGYIRVAVRTPDENGRLLRALA
jgi:histidinol-phosphate aminotransferase